MSPPAAVTGKTMVVLGIGIRAAVDGAGCLMASATGDAVKDLRRRLDLAIESPGIRDHFPARSGARARASWNNRQTPAGGWVSLAGAGSASQLSSRTAKVAIADEIARWPGAVRSGEGSPLALLRARLADWGEDARLLAISSPVQPHDGICLLHDDGDQRRVEYSCLACGERTPFTWEQVSGRGRGETPTVACVRCGAMHEETARRRMLKIAQVATPADEQTISFSLSWLDSRRQSLERLCYEYRTAVRNQKRGDPKGVKAFVNLKLGRPRQDGADVDVLMRNREDRFDLAPVVQLCAGVDVQTDRVVYVVLAFDAENRDVWVVDRGTVNGSPKDESTWTALDSLIGVPYGAGLRVSLVCVDAGFSTEDVRRACYRRRLWLPVVGRRGVGAPIAKRIGPTGICTVGRNAVNAWWSARLEGGSVHLPADLSRDDCAELAAAEALTAEAGALVWRPVEGRENHLWDAATYAIHGRFFRPIGLARVSSPRVKSGRSYRVGA